MVVTTLSSGGVNEETNRQLSMTTGKTKETRYRLSSSSSSDEEQTKISQNRIKSNAAKKLKMSESTQLPTKLIYS